jgi:hypothetical protein
MVVHLLASNWNWVRLKPCTSIIPGYTNGWHSLRTNIPGASELLSTPGLDLITGSTGKPISSGTLEDRVVFGAVHLTPISQGVKLSLQSAIRHS